MKSRYVTNILSLLAAMLLGLLGPGPGRAAASDEPLYCLRCHQGPVFPLGSLSWQGPVAGEREHPCPGVSRAKQELHQTQSLLFNAGKLLSRGPDRPPAESMLDLMRLRARFRMSLNQPLWSLEQVVQEQSAIRLGITDRILRPIWREQAAIRQGRLWQMGAWLFSILALAAFVMYLRHKRALNRNLAEDGRAESDPADWDGEGGPHETD